MDVRKDTSLGDGDSSEELVQFLIVSDGELDVTGSDSGSLVVLRSIARELEELSSQILEDSSHVDRSPRADTLGETSLTKVSSHAANRELESCLS